MLKTMKLAVFFGLFLFIFSLVGNVYAQNSNANQNAVDRANSRAVGNTNSSNSLNATDKASKAATRVQKLSENRLRICEARQEKIQNRFTNLMNLGTSSNKAFEMIVLRVSNYYDNNLVSQDTNPEAISALLADIDLKKADVDSSLEALRGVGSTFSCESDDPKGQAESFRAGMNDLIDAKKAYRQSIRAYVVAVRDLAKEVRAAQEAEVSEPTEEESATTSAGVVTQ